MAQVISFAEEEVVICKALMRNGYERKQLAKDLLSKLVAKGIITHDDTFVSVKSNVHLMNAIGNSIVLGLPTDLDSSTYGMKVVSDFDLYTNMATDRDFNDFLAGIKFDRNRPEYTILMKNRKNLRRFISRVKNSIVVEFELPETPDLRETKAPAPKKTKTDVANAIEKDLTAVNDKVGVINLFDDEAEECDEADEVVVKRKSRPITTNITDDDDDMSSDVDSSSASDGENHLYIPVSADFQVPLLELSSPDGSAGGDLFIPLLSQGVAYLKASLHDFKHGKTVMMKYNHTTNQIVLACTDATNWVHFQHSAVVDLKSTAPPKQSIQSPISPVSTDSSSDTSGLNKLYSSAMTIEDSRVTVLMDPQPMSTVKRGKEPSPKKCPHFAKGYCAFGDKCKFGHSG